MVPVDDYGAESQIKWEFCSHFYMQKYPFKGTFLKYKVLISYTDELIVESLNKQIRLSTEHEVIDHFL